MLAYANILHINILKYLKQFTLQTLESEESDFIISNYNYIRAKNIHLLREDKNMEN